MSTGADAAGAASAVTTAAHRYLVVGNPVAHSRSPEIHAAFARQSGVAVRYERLLVPTDAPDRFARAMDGFFAGGGRGANVTLPFKEQAFAYAAHCSERAALAQAVNTLAVREDGIHGDNTDGPGLVADLCGRLGLELAGKSVLLLGAGGAARGVVMSLLQAGIGQLSLANRTLARAQALAARFNEAPAVRRARLPQVRVLELSAAPPADLIVNATSSGILNGTLALPPALFRNCLLAYDCVYGPRPTSFMVQALAGGAGAASDGLGMLVEQAAESFLIWHGVRPATAPVYRELRTAIAAQPAGSAAVAGAAGTRAAGAADAS